MEYNAGILMWQLHVELTHRALPVVLRIGVVQHDRSRLVDNATVQAPTYSRNRRAQAPKSDDDGRNRAWFAPGVRRRSDFVSYLHRER